MPLSLNKYFGNFCCCCYYNSFPRVRIFFFHFTEKEYLHSVKWKDIKWRIQSFDKHTCMSLQFSCSVVSDSLWHHGLQHTHFPVLHHVPECAQNHVHQVSDAIQPSHPLSSPSPAFRLSQYQGLFQWVGISHQVAKGLEFQLQHQSFQWILRTDFL